LRKAVLDFQDTLINQSAVEFQLRFPRSPNEPEPAPLPFQMGPRPDKAATLVVKGRELYLKGPFSRTRPVPKNFNDQARPVNDFAPPGFFQVSLLNGCQGVIHYHEGDVKRLDKAANCCHIPLPQKGCGSNFMQLNNLAMDNFQINGKGKANSLIQPSC
jgi:hypothetical protein